MASIYQRKDSRFWWIKYRDAQGRIRQQSTGCLIGSGRGKRQARQMQAEYALAELKLGQESNRHAGWNWVPDFFQVRYQASPRTHRRYLIAWAMLKLFIEERDIVSPLNFTREHCYEFVAWRKRADAGKGKYPAGHNTALLEIRVLRILLHEAVERRIITGNPCVKLGFRREQVKIKAELTAEDCQKIRTGIAALEPGPVKEMLHLSFEIARHQGCRLMETQLNPLTDVVLGGHNTITFLQKGRREYVTLLHPALVPLFKELQAQGRTYTWKTPDNRHIAWASSQWWKFLSGLGLTAKGICFHSTRVTVVTELARANVHESKASSFVGHASTTVHRIYQRLRPRDLTGCVDVVGVSEKRP